MTYDAGFKAKVARLALQLGTITQVVQALKNEGYAATPQTVKKIINEIYPDKESWKQAHNNYVEILARNKAALDAFDDDAIACLFEARETLRKKIKDNPDDTHSQDVLALINTIKEIDRLRNAKQGKTLQENDRVAEVVNFFLNHPVIGEALKPFHKMIIKELEKIIEGKSK